LVVEQPVAIGGSTVLLGFLGSEARRIHAKSLLDRLATLFLDEVSGALRDHARLTAKRKPLAPSAVVRPGMRLHLALSGGAPLSTKELESALMARARSRFRVGSGRGRSRGGL